MRRLAALVLAIFISACASSSTAGALFTPSPPRATWIVAADGQRIGEANFTNAPGGVLIRLEFSGTGLPPGWHGAHLHERGDCSDFAAGFQAAGAHIGRAEHVQHGLQNPIGPEAGDLPNVFVAANPPYGAEFFLARVTLEAPTAERPALLDSDGSALIIHAGPDDQQSQPSGGAGPRLACAELRLAP